MRIQNLNSFVNVVKFGSFSKAAQIMNLSLSTISRQVSELEKELHNQLVNRKASVLTLTEFGEFYYANALRLKKSIDEFNHSIKLETGNLSGKLVISTPSYFLHNCIIPQMELFKRKYPKIELEIWVSENFPGFTNSIDIIFGVSEALFNGDNNQDVVVKTLRTCDFVICAAPEYLKSHPWPKLPEDLAEMNLISHSSRHARKTVLLKDGQKIVLNSTLSFNDSIGLVNSALAGLGIIQIHDFFVRKELTSGELIQLLPQFTPPSRFALYYKYTQFMNPKIAVFNAHFGSIMLG